MTLQQRIRRDQVRHTDDWLITYADTITLLLCLFVIVLTIKTAARLPASEATRPAVQTTALAGVFWDQPAVRSFVPVLETAPDSAPPPSTPSASNPVVEPVFEVPGRVRAAIEVASVPALPAPFQPAEPVRPEPARSEPARSEPVIAEPARSSVPDVVERLTARGTPIVAHAGDRITTLQIGSAAFFSSGSATLSNAGKTILGDVAGTLVSREFAAYHITIEGHTDDTPISTAQFPSNWELSAARAAAVVRFLLDLGVPAGKLTASGYADTLPIAPNRRADGTIVPENQAGNRRVVIRLEKIDKSKQ